MNPLTVPIVKGTHPFVPAPWGGMQCWARTEKGFRCWALPTDPVHRART